MARTGKTAKNRREQIMEAALRVFAKKGFAGATNKEIAREAGITPGLIYHYFESKEALLRATLKGRFPRRIIRLVPKGILDLPPEQFLRFVVLRMLSGVEERKYMSLLRAFLPEAIYHPEVASMVTALLAEGSRFIEGYLAARMESGELRKADRRLVADLVMGSVLGITLRRQVLHDALTLRYSRDQIVEGVVSLALRGLLTS